MAFIPNDSLTQVAFSIYENRGVFALLLGSGLSRAAEIPTGWEITLDLVRRVATAQGVKEQSDWEAWYRIETSSEPSYSRLLEELASSPSERRSILHSYIEPTENDREEGRKLPTAAHYAIADLVRSGYVKVIITTNFDRLLENALRERGVEPTIVASVDALTGAEPIAHSACYILKLHGDYKDARILNTESELSRYPKKYEALLDRIFDEYGLIVCGWSGEWDHALRSAMRRTATRRYPTYWTSRGVIGDGAKELIEQRRARSIEITDANSFFADLLQRVETLHSSQRRNPQTIELLIGSVKRLLAKPEFRIQLDELFIDELKKIRELTNGADFSPQGPWSQSVFRQRVKRYEAMAEPLAKMAGILGRWGEGNEFDLALDLIRSLYADAEKVRAGLVPYLNLRTYPAVLVFNAYALGLTRAGRWSTLYRLFSSVIDQENRNPIRAVQLIFMLVWKGADNDVWKQLEGHERDLVPLSEYLFALYGEWGKAFLGLTSDFELLFERLEVLGSLVFFEREDKKEISAALQAKPRELVAWIPIGRAGWHRSNGDKLITELTTGDFSADLLKAGFARGDLEFVKLFAQCFQRTASRIRW